MADLITIDLLKQAINQKIYTNENFEVSADDINISFIDTIDTLNSLFSVNNLGDFNILKTLVDDNKLTPGFFYSFDYETVTLVKGVAAGALLNKNVPGYTAITETLVIQAKTTNSFFHKAMSVNFPSDDISY